MYSSSHPKPLDTTTPAVILGFTISGLGVARSLASRGIECWILYNDPNDPALKTRYGRKRRLNDLEPDTILDALGAILEQTGQPAVLFPTSDSIVEACVDTGHALQKFLAGQHPPNQTLRECMSKKHLDGLFDQAGLDYPKTAFLEDGGDMESLSRLRYPCIVKPNVKSEKYTRQFQKAYLVDSADEALSCFDSIRALAPEAVVQEYLVGPDTEIFFCLVVINQSGEVIDRFAGRKLASWPRGTGSTVACIPAPEETEQLCELTERFFKASSFFGIGSLEFKRDPETGRFLAIEPTVARVDTQSEIAVLNGINLPLTYYCLQTGQQPPRAKTIAPRGWKDPAALSRLMRDSRDVPSYMETSIKLVDALWRPDDPGPWLSLHGRRLLRAPQVFLRRLGRKH